MSINKPLLWKMLRKFIKSKYKANDINCILFLVKTVVLNCPQKNANKRSVPLLWKLLSKGKSLFDLDDKTGLPIGNLSSQIFANFFLNEFDHILTNTFDFYGRYVDDFYIVDKDKQKILNFVPKIKEIAKNLNLTLSPNKVYIQLYYKGCSFIGGVVKSKRLYIGNRTISNCLSTINKFNKIKYKEKYVDDFFKSLNSYFGYTIHYKSFNIRKMMVSKIDKEWFQYISVSLNYNKFIKK